MAYIKDEYHWRQMASMQNMTMNPITQAQFEYHYPKNPLDGFDLRNCPMDTLELMIQVLTKEHDRRTMHTPMQGPTRAELENNPSLKEAWEAMMLIKKLQGK